jgi:hypothetical protein
MDAPSPLLPAVPEILLSVFLLAIVLAVAVASYRRSRCLSGHPIWKSVAIGVVAGAFWELWLIVWYVNRENIAQKWLEYRQTQQAVLAGQG